MPQDRNLCIPSPIAQGEVQTVWSYPNWECRILVKMLMKDSHIKFQGNRPAEAMFSHVDGQDVASRSFERPHGCT